MCAVVSAFTVMLRVCIRKPSSSDYSGVVCSCILLVEAVG
jgi:hypothetical protein